MLALGKLEPSSFLDIDLSGEPCATLYVSRSPTPLRAGRQVKGQLRHHGMVAFFPPTLRLRLPCLFQDWVRSNFGGSFWTGLNDLKEESVFRWTTQEPLSEQMAQ